MLRHQEEASSQNNAILQSLNDAVIVFSTDRSIILANAAAERILEKPIDELVTQSFDELLASLNIKLPGDPLGDVLANPGDHNGDQRAITIKRGPQSLSISLVPVLTERGELLGACLIGRDITREVESDRLKTEFIGTVSHELRTPMTSIKGYTQLLAMGSLGEVNPTQKEFLTTITTNAERMIAIINDLLDITKIETGSVELQPSRMHVAEVLSAVVSSNRLELSQREHELALNLSPNLPLLWGDPERLRQVVQNILTNAIKYTPRGGKIAVTAREIALADIPAAQREGLPLNRRYIAIAVQDTGVGIDPEEQDRIFERFYRTENPLKIEAGGTGLGLSLVRPLLNLMGGRIWVTSTADQGSTFTFTMPVAPAE
ncbi:MAG: PAS domain-containing protein, partial [Herpetosiphonaceae bacterium]|nr:PAS domain-containing protein [Herpetosiphonaceae bacterium]